MIEIVDKLQLAMDIKPHPCGEENSDLYFRKLMQRINKGKNIRLLKGFAAEEIIKDYGLLVLDHIGSALVSTAVIFDLPILIYLKDTSYIRQEIMPDLKNRFYFVNNKSELEQFLTLFREGRLASKFSLNIVDRYAFPINNGNPSVNIADYIHKRISNVEKTLDFIR